MSRATLLGAGQHTGLNTVDLVQPVSGRYAGLAIGRVLRGPLRGTEISMLAPEDVVIFKILSTRARDLDDAVSIVRTLGARLDLASINREIDQLAREIPDHNIEERWKEVVR